MVHGTAGYFIEHARFARRVTLITVLVSVAFLGLLRIVTVRPVSRVLTRSVKAVRFGFEGPDQYVRRISLRQFEGRAETLSDMGRVDPLEARRGGKTAERRTRDPHGKPEHRLNVKGPGLSDHDLVARATSRLAHVPVFRSEDLVIEILVRPSYPPNLVERDIEGRVTLQALVDTTGKVVDVQMMASSGEPQFERAAEEAVWQCRFRPYRPEGMSSEVYAVFRFAFTIH